ncbi:MAG TPA: YkvA family protein, partial [Geminicoccaceae bacterium]|nr:YkvA family protein [Geminicoccaceae bacterium]
RPSALSEAGAIARFGVMSTDTEYSIAHLPVSYTPPDEQRFWRKVRRVVARVPFAEDLLAAYFCAMDRDTPSYVRGVLLGAVAYFVLPLDMIPDILAPLGFTDDASVIAAAIAAVGSNLQPRHRQEARARLEQLAD